jgi:16S rRNA (cytidine1402-2'-O)-methyltransferase
MRAVEEVAAHQHYPQGSLYMVATPIGNLADIGLRALHVLGLADTVACEDTRHTASLMTAYGLHKPLLALHEHNESQAAQTVVERLQAGQRVAYVSDAGTPGISDPGARLVQAVQAAGLRVMPIPGASSVTTLLSASGHVGWDGAFVFAGFLSPKSTERQRQVRAIAADPRACVVLEAPHRVSALAQDLAALGPRRLTVGRELTKQFESITPMAAGDWPAWLQADANHSRGEFVILVHPLEASEAPSGLDEATQRTLGLLLAELPLKTAVKVCADITGQSRNALYDAALALRESQD